MRSTPEKTVVRTTILPLNQNADTREVTVTHGNIVLVITVPEDSGAIRSGDKIIVGEMSNVRTILFKDVQRVARGELMELPLGMYKMPDPKRSGKCIQQVNM